MCFRQKAALHIRIGEKRILLETLTRLHEEEQKLRMGNIRTKRKASGNAGQETSAGVKRSRTDNCGLLQHECL